MKKRVIMLSTFALATAFTSHVFAQKAPAASSKFYLKASGGYFFSVTPGQFPDVGQFPPHDVRREVDPATGATTTLSEKVLTGSYGQGARGGLTFGWNINQYIGIEATFNYFRSSKNLMTKQLTTRKGTSQVLGDVASHGYAQAIDFMPSIVLNPGFAKLNPYVRFGAVLPLWGNLNIETDALVSGTATLPGVGAVLTRTNIHREERIKPSPTIGFQGALGATYPISRKLDIFLEMEYRNVPVKGKEKEVKVFDQTTTFLSPTTGQPIPNVPQQKRGLNDLSTAERNTEYVTTIDQNSNTPTGQNASGGTNYKDNNRPANELKSYINIGGLGFNAGLRFRL
ncbi:hypothetical protein KTO58_09555 [Chitinophaga pendula]|uniref:outer membrane beta-barrel protein n=1 Tax=Chitinophaga TaxID=79328 RepID=UPI000BAED0E9|nr:MULTISPECIES: outer membrane beta-barrel protein [Chitinophaga]ASZ12959.1 hypothetical protein CK934_19345 [Chitinophaga sp. MD30]UCJ09409.1 hypothetical protein KTO58_09555 [Chitinophaga pendula]